MSNSTSDSKNQERISGVFIPLQRPENSGTVRLEDWYAYFMTKKWLIALTTCAVVIISVIVAFLATPIYRAEVLLAANSEQTDASLLSGFADQFGALSSVAGINVGDNVAVEEAIATLKSRDFTIRFIRSENLMPVLFADEWNTSSGNWKHADQEDVPSDWDAFDLFDTEIRTVSEESNGLFRVRIDWRDRELAAAWANRLVAMLNELMRRRAIEEATENIEYLQKELQGASIVELRMAISRLIEAEVKKAMLARARDQYSFKVIDPAVVADADRYIKPNRPLIVVSGFFIGLVLGLLLAMVSRKRTFKTE